MSEVTIRTLKNGPYEVKGTVRVVDAKRNAFRLEEETVYLCRCGRSATKPFCDGTHNTCGFVAEETAS